MIPSLAPVCGLSLARMRRSPATNHLVEVDVRQSVTPGRYSGQLWQHRLTLASPQPLEGARLLCAFQLLDPRAREGRPLLHELSRSSPSDAPYRVRAFDEYDWRSIPPK